MQLNLSRIFGPFFTALLLSSCGLFGNLVKNDRVSDNRGPRNAAEVTEKITVAMEGAVCDPEKTFGVFVENKCLSCHTNTIPALPSLKADTRLKFSHHGKEWVQILSAIKDGKMPPNNPAGDEIRDQAAQCLANLFPKDPPVVATCPSEPKALDNKIFMVSKNYYKESFKQLLANDVYQLVENDIDAFANTISSAPFSTYTSRGDYAAVDVAFRIGWKIVTVGYADNAKLNALATCFPTYATLGAAEKESCVKGFIQNYGVKTLKRPLTAEDTQRFYQSFLKGQQTVDFHEGVRMILAHFFQSPEFLYNLESGLLNTAILSQTEVLNKLTRYLWNKAPTDAERTFASGHNLLTADGIAAVANQLLSQQAAKDNINQFYMELLKLPTSLSLTTNSEIVGTMNTNGLYGEALQEFKNFLELVIFTDNGKVSDLFRSNRAKLPTSRMATLYDMPSAQVNQPLNLNSRKGLLTRAALLMNIGERVNAFHYGSVVAKNLFCAPMGVPPDNVNDLVSTIQVPADATVREKAELLTGGGVCQSCHAVINPFGFARLNFSPIGQNWALEKVIVNNQVVRSVAPVTGVTLKFDGATIQASDVADLSEKVADLPSTRACFVQKFTSYAEGRDVTTLDRCLSESIAKTTAGDSVKGLLIKLFTSQEFRMRKSEP